jgi:PAS domain S-box-containing protein
MLLGAWESLIEQVEEGVHIVDDQGVTVVYNRAMSEIEGYTASQTIGRHLLEIFPNWQKENSTLLTVLANGEPILGRQQQYVNVKGKRITTVNTAKRKRHNHWGDGNRKKPDGSIPYERTNSGASATAVETGSGKCENSALLF